MKNQEMKLVVVNCITESGAMNDFVEHIHEIEVKGDFYILHLTTGQTIVLDIVQGLVIRLKRGIRFNPSRSYVWETRLVWTYVHPFPLLKQGKNARKDRSDTQSDLSMAMILPIVKEIIDNGGKTRETYLGMEGNHMVPKDFEVDNGLYNLELCDPMANKRHWAAWSKVMAMLGLRGKDRLRLMMSANDVDLVAAILNKHCCYTGNFGVDYANGVFMLTNNIDTIEVYNLGRYWHAQII